MHWSIAGATISTIGRAPQADIRRQADESIINHTLLGSGYAPLQLKIFLTAVVNRMRSVQPFRYNTGLSVVTDTHRHRTTAGKIIPCSPIPWATRYPWKGPCGLQILSPPYPGCGTYLMYRPIGCYWPIGATIGASIPTSIDRPWQTKSARLISLWCRTPTLLHRLHHIIHCYRLICWVSKKTPPRRLSCISNIHERILIILGTNMYVTFV